MPSYCHWLLHNAPGSQNQPIRIISLFPATGSLHRQIHKPPFPGTSNRRYSLQPACSQSKKFLFQYFLYSGYQLLRRALCKCILLYAGSHLLIKLSILSSSFKAALIFQALYPFIDCFLRRHVIKITPFHPFCFR